MRLVLLQRVRLPTPNTHTVYSYCFDVINRNSHYTLWNAYTPEFHLTVVLISSPVALLVGLWGVTNKLTRQLLWSRDQQEAPIMSRTLSTM